MIIPLRVMVLTSEFPPARGGIQLLQQRLAASMTQVEMLVMTLGEPQPDDALQHYLVRRTGVGRRRLAVARLNAVSIAAAFQFRPNVVLSGHILCAPAAWAIRRLLGVPYVQYAYAKELGHRTRLARAALGRADAVIAISRYTRDLVFQLESSVRQVHVVACGIDPPVSRRHGRDATPTILTVARLDDAHKGHDVLLRSLPTVRRQIPGARMVFVGDGELRRTLESHAASLGVSSCVEFTGAVSDSDRDRWLDRAHVFAMPSRVEPRVPSGDGYGIVYLEAGAHALPVVAGAEGGTLDSVLHQRTGLLVDPRDHGAVAQALIRVLSDAALAATLGEGGLSHARALSWDRIASEVREVLQGVSDQHHGDPAGSRSPRGRRSGRLRAIDDRVR